MENGDSTAAADVRRLGWLGRNWKWCVPLVLLVLVLLCAGAAVALIGQGEFLDMYRANKEIQASEPFRMAMEQIRADAEVTKRLGEKIEVSGAASGSVETESDSTGRSAGSANFYFNVSGTKEAADVACQAKMIDGRWGLSTLKVTFADGTQHAVEIAGEDGSLEEAPPWSP